MDWIEAKDVILSYFRKYRWAAVILLIGLMLMALPQGKEAESAPEGAAQAAEPDLQQELEDLLGRLEGAGKVRLLLTTAAGAETHYQTNEDLSKTADSGDKRVETVVITGADRSESGLVQRIDPPQYLGAVVLCQGADSAAVRLAVVEAVAAATGLTSDKISVLKMK